MIEAESPVGRSGSGEITLIAAANVLLSHRWLVLFSGTGKRFDGRRVQAVRRAYGLASREQRLRAAGVLTLEEAVKRHHREGTLALSY